MTTLQQSIAKMIEENPDMCDEARALLKAAIRSCADPKSLGMIYEDYLKKQKAMHEEFKKDLRDQKPIEHYARELEKMGFIL